MGRQFQPSRGHPEGRGRCGLEKLRRLIEQLPDDTVIVCVGSTLLGDDGAGPALARLLEGAAVRWRVFDAGIAPENYLMPIARLRPSWVVLVDALDFGARPGEVGVFEMDDLTGATPGTHGPDLTSFASLLRRMTRCRVVVVGVQPIELTAGSRLSHTVAKAVGDIAEAFAR